MKDNYSHITLLIDRSGSMGSIQAEAQGAVNAFIADQKEVEGTATLFLADFDGTEPLAVHFDGDLAFAEDYTLSPRGMTPLNDAIGLGIKATGEALDALKEDEKPSNVVFVIVTDGGENASQEYTNTSARNLIKHHEDKYDWSFVFLASGMEAQSASYNYAGTHMISSNTVFAADSGAAYAATMNHMSANVKRTRSGAKFVSYAASVDVEGNVDVDEEDI